jgi:hypothetical protein
MHAVSVGVWTSDGIWVPKHRLERGLSRLYARVSVVRIESRRLPTEGGEDCGHKCDTDVGRCARERFESRCATRNVVR